MFRPVALAPLAALAPAAAFAVDYLSAAQAARLMFPDAEAFVAREVALDAAQMQALEARHHLRARSARWTLQAAQRGGRTLGWVVTDDVIGKFERITYAVGLDLDGRIRQVEVLAYRESHGGEVRLPAWRRQFVGKGEDAKLEVGEDIANLSGATVSCTHLTEGVRRIVAVVAAARRAGQLE